MEDYKVKVGSEAESKEVQGLFFELGYVWNWNGKANIELFDFKPILLNVHNDMTLTQGSFLNEDHKEITIPQLRDMVVLKRNDPKDATHYRSDGKEYFQTCDKERYYYFQDGCWVLSTWMNYQLLPQLKPITKEPIMKEYLNKLEDGTYKLVLLDSIADGVEGLIEVPEGMNYAYKDEFNIHFTKLEMGYRDSIIVWQRETLNDKVASAEVARQEFIGDQPTAFDTQISGDHYKLLPIQPMKFALANGLDYAQGNVIKYVIRHASKGGKDDLLKAIHNIELMIEHYYG